MPLDLFFSEGSIEIIKGKLRFDNMEEVKYSLECASDTDKLLTIKAIRIPMIADKYEYGHMVAIMNNPI